MKSKFLTLLVVIGFISSCSIAQISNKFEMLDVFNLEQVTDPQISPDGEKVVYVRAYTDIMTDRTYSNLWVVNFDGSNNRPITTGNQRESSPKWSHDGKKLVYISNKGGSAQIYLRWMDTNEETKLTNVNTGISDVNWSKDDKFLAFTMFKAGKKASMIKLPAKPAGAEWNSPPIYIDDLNYRRDGRGYVKPGFNQIYILPVEGGTPRQITDSTYNHANLEWSNDGKALYFSANTHHEDEKQAKNSEIFRLNLADGSIAALTSRFGPDSNPILSPDGKKIAYLGFDDNLLGYQNTHLYVMDIDGNNSKHISKGFDRDIRNVNWDEKGKGFYFQYSDKGIIKIAYMTLTGNVTDLIDDVGGLSTSRPYIAGSFSITNKGKYAYTLGGNYPSDLAVGEQKSSKRITNYNEDLFQYKKLGNVEEMWYESSYDGRQIQSWIVTPPDFDPSKKYPLILEIHGGPFSSYGYAFSAENQLYAANGYVVLYTNPRGSTCYGEEFANLIHHNYPGNDYDDLMTGVDAIISKGYIDERNLFVTGGSGGGVLSAWIIGKTDRFNAAVVAKPVINWYSFALYSDLASVMKPYWFADYPWENPERYMERSPISLIEHVSTPTMLLTGEEDMRTPIAESEQYYAALKLRGVEAAMVRIPNSYHGIASRPSNLIAKVSAVLTWFEKHKVGDE